MLDGDWSSDVCSSDLSGVDALPIALKLFRFYNEKNHDFVESHRMYYGHVVDDDRVIDEVMMVFMNAPASYTAENVVEIQSHSSPIVLKKILDLVLRNGAVMAGPGEFTRRAFMNGRIDLTQAEAVIDIINARTSTSLDMAISQINGNLKGAIQAVRESMTDLYARLEAVIDFPDDVGDIFDDAGFLNVLRSEIIEPLRQLSRGFDDYNVFRDGIRAVIVGPPNSGKSSLLNALLDKEKSIVTSIPGTTRDLIDDIINIDGIPFELTDTAGIQETEDPVEQIGIRKTYEKLKHADVIIVMTDVSRPASEIELKTIQTLLSEYSGSKKVIVVANKIDVNPDGALQHGVCSDIAISAKNRIGLDGLKRKIADAVVDTLPENRNSIVPNVRHNRLIQSCIQCVNDVIFGIENGVSCDLMAEDMKTALGCLDDILGMDPKTDVLDRIFGTFCIGK
jgi:tRNA modification GTPase